MISSGAPLFENQLARLSRVFSEATFAEAWDSNPQVR